jgi:hypothetical protein
MRNEFMRPGWGMKDVHMSLESDHTNIAFGLSPLFIPGKREISSKGLLASSTPDTFGGTKMHS